MVTVFVDEITLDMKSSPRIVSPLLKKIIISFYTSCQIENSKIRVKHT